MFWRILISRGAHDECCATDQKHSAERAVSPRTQAVVETPKGRAGKPAGGQTLAGTERPMTHSTKNDNPDLYEQDVHWDRDFGRHFYEKKRIFQALIGPDATSVLDVGCGDGKITNDLCPGKPVVGCDRSMAALKRVTRAKVQASCDRLPFADRSFDVVLCSEVLEHLPAGVFDRTIAEISRIADHHIVLSVPNRETLATRRTRCAFCGTVYNVDGHLRSFDSPRELTEPFHGFKPTFVGFCGDADGRPPGWLVRLEHRVVADWPQSDIAMCPGCGSKRIARTDGRSWLRWLLERIRWRLLSQPVQHLMILKLERET